MRRPVTTPPKESAKRNQPTVTNDELLLPASMSRLQRNRDSQQVNKNKERLRNRTSTQIFQLFKEGPDFTCNVLVGHKAVKALVDTGASVSLINSKVVR